MHLSEQELQRRKEREELMKMGIDPYPAEMYHVNATAADIRAMLKHTRNFPYSERRNLLRGGKEGRHSSGRAQTAVDSAA